MLNHKLRQYCLEVLTRKNQKKVETRKDEAARRIRDNEKFREKKEALERKTNKMITEKIDKKVQNNNKSKK